MKLPQPERIFGPDDGAADDDEEAGDNVVDLSEDPVGVSRRPSVGGKGKAKAQGVTPDAWHKIKLDDEVPEAVRTGRMTHSRNASRV